MCFIASKLYFLSFQPIFQHPLMVLNLHRQQNILTPAVYGSFQSYNTKITANRNFSQHSTLSYIHKKQYIN